MRNPLFGVRLFLRSIEIIVVSYLHMSYIAITLSIIKLARNIKKWEMLTNEVMTLYQYIYFEVGSSTKS